MCYSESFFPLPVLTPPAEPGSLWVVLVDP